MLPTPTPLTLADHGALRDLLMGSRRPHIHLDWLQLDHWLRDDNFVCYVLRSGAQQHSGAQLYGGDRLRAALGATVQVRDVDGDISRAAWVRLALPMERPGDPPLLDRLWDAVREDLVKRGVGTVAGMSVDRWIEGPFKRWGFEPTSRVITLIRHDGEIPEGPKPPFSMREAGIRDLPILAALDAAAFDSVWAYDERVIDVAYRQAASVSIIEEEEKPVGYQLSTWFTGHGHLARLAVLPEYQGRGLGGILIGQMLRYFEGRDVFTVTVNTQDYNLKSKRLYERLGFRPATPNIPFWTLALDGV